jgi:transposase
MSDAITLSRAERMELTQRATSQAGRADDARRARLILRLEAGETWAEIRDRLACNDDFIDRWSKRFGAERLAGLFSRHAGQSARVLTPQLEARILEWTVKRKPTDGSTHWSTRKLGEQLSVSHMMIAWSCPGSVDSLRLESVVGVEGRKAPAGCGAEPRPPSTYVGSCGGRLHPPFVVDG